MTDAHLLTAQQIFDVAPLGAIIRFSDSAPKPPARCSNLILENVVAASPVGQVA